MQIMYDYVTITLLRHMPEVITLIPNLASFK